MDNGNDQKELKQDNYNISVPKGSTIKTPDDEEDFGDWIFMLIEFIRSPEFVEKILPVFGEHLQRKHTEVIERISKEKKEMEIKAKYNSQFLLARVIVGLILVGAVTTLTVFGKIATETTIVTMMVTIGFIIWGNRD